MIDYPVDETQNKVQILRSDKPEKLKVQGLLAILVGKQSIADAFEVKELSKTKSEIKYELKPKQKDLQVQVVELIVDLSTKRFKSISYQDEIGNKTIFHFKKYKFSEKSPDGFFDFQQPNNSSVTDI
jgi:outer membrane lipoprotein-sorting protein